jgi:hypothetical protein
VTIGEVRVLFADLSAILLITIGDKAPATYPPTGGLWSNDFCNFDNFAGSLYDFFNLTTFSTRSFDLKERLNMAAVVS